MPLQSEESFPSLSRNEKAGLEILPSLLSCNPRRRERTSQPPTSTLHFAQGLGVRRHFPHWLNFPLCSALSALP